MSALFTLALLAAPGDADVFGHDANNIRWELPAAFETARTRAKDEHRLLLIKGVSFNIDEAGATCPTKGTW